MVYLGNLVALIQEVIKQQKPGIILAGDGEVLSTSHFVKYLIEATGQRRYFIAFPLFFQYLIKRLKPGFYNRLFGSQVIDNSKTLRDLNFVTPYSPREGLKEVMNSL
jgi:UDP-glucose 4-epimerase